MYFSVTFLCTSTTKKIMKFIRIQKRRTTKTFIIIGALLLATAIVYAWGFTAHQFINLKAVMHLPPIMDSFAADSLFYEAHSVDPDIRRNNSDTTFLAEQWRHYIDIDDYPDFHNISHNLDTLLTQFGWEYVKTTGLNPWATVWALDSLTAQLRRGDAASAKQTASDLGHYVGDAHQPLHCTKNYNGQYTGNNGIHSRYESTMINTYEHLLAVAPDSIHYVESPIDFIFDYIYHSQSLVDSVLEGDNYAKLVSGWDGNGTAPPTYYEALWERTKDFTLDQIQRATVDLASLWYTAWVNAGFPIDSLAPSLLNFGGVYIGSNRIDSVTLTNMSAELLSVSSVTSSNSQFTIFPTSAEIPVLSTQTFYITFTPASRGSAEGIIIFDKEISDDTITVNGEGLLPFIVSSHNNRWNLISNPVLTTDDSVRQLFPSSIFPYAFRYENGYVQEEQLQHGRGYWAKFPSADGDSLFGFSIMIDTIDVVEGWNLIGSISQPISIGEITSPSPTMTSSQFFGYEDGYQTADTIKPGKGYWVKVNEDGELILSSVVVKAHTLKIIPTSEMPPSPPSPETKNLRAETFALEQNYPNPFNPKTEIRYQMSEVSYVTLKIYNMLGEEVAVLVDGIQEAGQKTITWDAAAVPSGVYIAQLTLGNLRLTRKLLLMR